MYCSTTAQIHWKLYSGRVWRVVQVAEYTDLDALHLKLVVHVVDSQTSLVDEEVDTGIHLDKQLFCVQSHMIVLGLWLCFIIIPRHQYRRGWDIVQFRPPVCM